MKLLTVLALMAMSANAQKAHPMISSSTDNGDQVITHLAVGGGWQTTVTLVNLGNVPASFTINFVNDQGKLQDLPFSGFGINSTLTGQQIPVGGRWTINSAGDPLGVTNTGWALINNVVGNIGGY